MMSKLLDSSSHFSLDHMSKLIEQVKHISGGQYPKTNKRTQLSNKLLEISELDQFREHRDLLKQAAEIISVSKYTQVIKKQICDKTTELVPVLRYHLCGTSMKLVMITSGVVYDQRDMILSTYLREGKCISLSKYFNNHVLYAFITDIDKDKCTIKFGYTYDLASRPDSLQTEYKATFYLIGAKIIAAEKDEKTFHKILKKNYPNLIYNHKINKTNKKELYYFEPVLMEEFEKFESSVLPKEVCELLIEREKTNQCKTNLLIKKEKSHQCDTNLLIKKEEIVLVDKQIILADKQNENLKLQIELAKLQKA